MRRKVHKRKLQGTSLQWTRLQFGLTWCPPPLLIHETQRAWLWKPRDTRKAIGSKLKPHIVFRVDACEGNAAADFQRSDCYTFNTDWLQSVVGKFNFTLHLLDSYHCHISAATKAELKCGYNVITVVISGGCTKYIQAPHVMWNQSFKQNLHDAYDQWMAGDIDKE